MSIFVESKHVSIVGESLFWFPQCFGDRISFPFHIVLIASSSFLMINDRIYFIDFFFVFEFRQQFREIRSVDIILFVRLKEGVTTSNNSDFTVVIVTVGSASGS